MTSIDDPWVIIDIRNGKEVEGRTFTSWLEAADTMLTMYQRSAKGKRPDAREDLYFYRVRQRSEMRWRR